MVAIHFYCNTYNCYTPELLGIYHLQRLTPSVLPHLDAIQLPYNESATINNHKL